jgi:hypothetical protein
LQLPSIFGPKRATDDLKKISKKDTAKVLTRVNDLIRAMNSNDMDGCIHLSKLVADTVEWDDYSFQQICHGKQALERRFRLQQQQKLQNPPRIEMDDIIITSTSTDDAADENTIKSKRKNPTFQVGIKYRQMATDENDNGVNYLRGLAILEVSSSSSSSSSSSAAAAVDSNEDDAITITKATWVTESTNKSGEMGLRVLSVVGKFLFPQQPSSSLQNQELSQSLPRMSPPEQYFAAWNARDMNTAVQLFDENVCYDDAAFPVPFQGKENLKNHLNLVAQCFPPSFSFVVDHVLHNDVKQEEQSFRSINKKNGGNGRYIVQWHVENNGTNLPFARGMSYYTTSIKQGNNREIIQSGLDLVEPDPPKTADLALTWNCVRQQFQAEPIRWIPLVTWIAYLYIVFMSDHILPGANALQLEQRTWEEVRDLSLNFFLVAPTLGLSFSPVVHPLLECVFNVLLAWAALFAGFLADDERCDKPNTDLALGFFPTVVGMQFLTSAFLLPYLSFRSSETNEKVTYSEISKPAQIVGESRILGPSLAIVGTYAIFWGIFGRYERFGELSERWTSFLDLLSIDRVGSSFLVDLVIFGLFQNWMIDDDLKRRGIKGTELHSLRWIGKCIPFFGLAFYFAVRPPFLQTEK